MLKLKRCLRTTNQIVKNPTAVDVSTTADWIVIIFGITGKQELEGLLFICPPPFFRYVIFKDRSSNSGQQHLGLLIIPAGYGKPGTGKKVKNTSVFPKLCTQNATAFDLLPSFVRRWLRVISSSFLLAGSRNYQIIGLPFCLTD